MVVLICELDIPEDSQQGFLVPVSSSAISGCWGSGRGQGVTSGGKPCISVVSPECVQEQQSRPWELARHPGPWAPLPADLLNEDLRLQSFRCREPWGFCQGRGGLGSAAPRGGVWLPCAGDWGLGGSPPLSGPQCAGQGDHGAHLVGLQRGLVHLGSAPYRWPIRDDDLALDLTLIPIIAHLSLSSFFWLLFFCSSASFPLWTTSGCADGLPACYWLLCFSCSVSSSLVGVLSDRTLSSSLLWLISLILHSDNSLSFWYNVPLPRIYDGTPVVSPHLIVLPQPGKCSSSNILGTTKYLFQCASLLFGSISKMCLFPLSPENKCRAK